MFVGIGYLIILGSVLGGFVAAGGHLGALMQPLEVVMIAGAAIGACEVLVESQIARDLPSRIA